MVPLRVGVLGPVTVWRDGREQAAGQPRQLAVLGVLATRANRVVSRGELVDAVWGDQPPASAEGGIYTYVAGLRRVIEPDRPRRDPDRSRPGAGHGRSSPAAAATCSGSVSAPSTRSSSSGAWPRPAGCGRTCDLGGALRAVDEALALCRGLPYAGVPGPFAEAEQRRLTELRTTAIEERAELLLAQGQAAAAVPELTALAAAHPLREQATGLLMIALYRCGRQAEALRVFGETRKRLAEDLGIDPGSELTRIHRQLLAMDPALDGPVIAPPVTIGAVAGDPGSARRRPAERRGVASAPAGPAAAQPAPVPVPSPAQLPPEVAGFAGRTAELRWLHGLLAATRPPAPRQPGGADHRHGGGRQDDARDQVRPPGRVAVPRRPALREPARVRPGQRPGAARAPRCRGSSTRLTCRPGTCRPSLDAQSALLRTLLDGKRVLLLLDNAHDADQVRPLLPGSAGCLVLVTSRSQLTGLVVADGARPLPLGVLDGVEAAELLARRLGSEPRERGTRGDGGAGRADGRAAAGAERDLRAGGVAAGRGCWPTSPPSSPMRGTGWTRWAPARRQPTCAPSSPGRSPSSARPRPGRSGCSACIRARISPPPRRPA